MVSRNAAMLVLALSAVAPVAQAQKAADRKASPAPAAATAPASGSGAVAGAADPGLMVLPPDVAPAEAPAPAAAEDEVGKPDSVEIQIRRLADKLAAGFRARAGGGRYERWAVVPFNELGDDVKKRHLGEVVAAQVETTLKNDHAFFCVERRRLSAILQEVQLAQAGVVDEATAPKVGELAGADVLVVGSVGLLGDHYVVNARAVAASEGKILSSAQVQIKAAGLVALSSDAVVLRTRSDAVFRSLLIPGWGQMYNRQEQKGAFIMFAAGALLAGGGTFQALGKLAQNEYGRLDPKTHPGACAGRADAQFGACVAEQRELAESRYRTANALFIGAAAVYAYNVLDAWIFGYSPDASTESLYAGGLQLDVSPESLGVRATF